MKHKSGCHGPNLHILRFQPKDRTWVWVQQEQWQTIKLPTWLCLLTQSVNLLWRDGSLHCRRNRHLLVWPAHCSVFNHFCEFMCTMTVFSVIVERWTFLKAKVFVLFCFFSIFLAILLSFKRRHSHWGCNGRKFDFVWALSSVVFCLSSTHFAVTSFHWDYSFCWNGFQRKMRSSGIPLASIEMSWRQSNINQN